MGRPLRMKASDLTFHITSRTNGKRLFMHKKKDQKMLCRVIRRILLKYGVAIHAFAPMMNHFHMLIHIANDSDLSQVIGEIKCTYAKYYNKKYGICGHFWGDRFRSTIIEDDRHALACLRYIDRNPVKAGLVDHPAQWQLNSFSSYALGQVHPILPLEPHPTYLALAKAKTRRRQIYLDFVLQQNSEADGLHGRLPKLQIFGSEEFELAVRNGFHNN